jgi:hypothetical protein
MVVVAKQEHGTLSVLVKRVACHSIRMPEDFGLIKTDPAARVRVQDSEAEPGLESPELFPSQAQRREPAAVQMVAPMLAIRVRGTLLEVVSKALQLIRTLPVFG